MEVNVIDIGCGATGDFDSLEHLVDRFKPSFAFGFDPRITADWYSREGTTIVKLAIAAWDRAGTVDFREAGLRSTTSESGESDGDTATVPCADIAIVVRSLEPCILKIDAEGAEYRLLEHLLATGADECLERVLIEWHGDTSRAGDLIDRLRCEYEEWTY